jgi:hypothetical protein
MQWRFGASVRNAPDEAPRDMKGNAMSSFRQLQLQIYDRFHSLQPLRA